MDSDPPGSSFPWPKPRLSATGLRAAERLVGLLPQLARPGGAAGAGGATGVAFLLTLLLAVAYFVLCYTDETGPVTVEPPKVEARA